MNPPTQGREQPWFVTARVFAQIEAPTKDEAMQELCNRLASGDERGAPQDYEVSTVSAEGGVGVVR